MPIPELIFIYHIVHVRNLPSIVRDGHLWPDSVMMGRDDTAVIGNQQIKQDRLNLPVHCYPETMVGDYVPFYFCPRSVMLYVISRGNHPNVAYRDGQRMVVHLVCRLRDAVAWANSVRRKWAFTDINAANRLADFYSSLDDLNMLNWNAIGATNWSGCRDHKMAEFLMHQGFPWHLVRGIGVFDESVGRTAQAAFGNAEHRPTIKVKREWYY